MLDIFSKSIQNKLDSIGRKTSLTEEDLKQELKEIRRILVEADVNYFVAKKFCKELLEESINSKILVGLNPGEQVVKLVKDKMINLLDGDNQLHINKNDSILMVGLQGNGKTTTTGKLALYLRKNYNYNVLMVGVDVYRPAAIDQLIQIGKELNIGVYYERDNKNVIEIATNAQRYAKENNYDFIIYDTAGRTHVDEKMMEEIQQLQNIIKPQETLLVLDGAIGQVAIEVAEEFDKIVNISGLIFTKMDSDTRGGAIFSVKEVINKDIKFLGTSEKMTGLESFNPERIVNRILGNGDIVGLIEKAEEYAQENDIEQDAQRLLDGKFDFNDYLKQIEMMNKMGGFTNLLGMIPGFNKIDTSKIDEKEFVKIKAMIQSMTPQERKKPMIINGSRRKRIASGSGCSVQDVNKLLKNYEQTKMMMKRMKNMDMSKMMNLFK